MTKELRFLLQRALKDVDALPAEQRVTLYEGISQVTTGNASAEAKGMAYWHRQLVVQQRDFLGTLFGGDRQGKTTSREQIKLDTELATFVRLKPHHP